MLTTSGLFTISQHLVVQMLCDSAVRRETVLRPTIGAPRVVRLAWWLPFVECPNGGFL